MKIRHVGRSWVLLVVVTALVIGGAACGNSKAGEAGSTAPEDVTSATGVTEPSAAPVQADKNADKHKVGTANSTTTTTATDGKTPATVDLTNALVRPGSKGQLEVKATLGETCVRPGEMQSITILTRPGSGVGYDTVYSDGKSGLMPGHHGGNFGGHVDDNGTWSDTWVVGPTAPPGKVRVNVLAAHLDYGNAQTTPYFTVADPTGRCT